MKKKEEKPISLGVRRNSGNPESIWYSNTPAFENDEKRRLEKEKLEKEKSKKSGLKP